MYLMLILLLASTSYIIGVSSILRGTYQPSIYSRVIWLLIATNSFAGVLALHANIGTLLLALIQLIGSAAMAIAAWRHSLRTFGLVEELCSALLVISLIVWLTAHNPLLNVLLSLVAHLIGAVPTLMKAVKNPDSENFLFWASFAAASIIAFTMADKTTIQGIVYALYFALFDSLMATLAARQYLVRNRKLLSSSHSTK